MSRDESLLLADIKDSCEKVLKYTAGMSSREFEQDELHYDAVLRNLEIIGEAIKHISAEQQRKYPQVEWRKIAGFRDIVSHQYFGVSGEIVWDIIVNKIPVLLQQINDILTNK